MEFAIEGYSWTNLHLFQDQTHCLDGSNKAVHSNVKKQ